MKTKGRSLLARVSVSLFIGGLIVFLGFKVRGQEWTAEQKEVWNAVEADIELFKKGDVDGVLASRHDDVVIWWDSKPIPYDKELLRLNYKQGFDYDKPVNWELEPLAIKIIGNVASVFYTYKFSGIIFTGSSRAIQTWIKQDNKWLMINALTASCDKLPPCKQ